MKVLVAEKCGFCLGVKNAISMAEKTLDACKERVYSLGPIIHNEDVVQRLAKNGLKTVDSLDEIENGTVLIRSHGVTPQQMEQIKEKGLNIVDATCVLVKRVQKIVSELSEAGYEVVVIGDKNHPEVKAVVGCASKVTVIADKKDLANIPVNKKLGVVSQTTQSARHFSEMIGAIAKIDFSEIRVINTLCNEAKRRQQAAVALCKQVDVMFVLGGLSSANTRKLAELCKTCNEQTFHLQNWKELDKSVLLGKNIAGVTAGASTPDWVIDEFVEYLKAYE